ncbi:MAG: TldD/PmbA family protein [Myxococcales bacterium]|nr:TldD/PmbA family protein [Myxococcales bacterium]
MLSPIDPNLLSDLLAVAKRAGATDGDAVAVAQVSSDARVRLGEVEQVVRAEEHAVGFRVFVGDRSAMVSGNDLRREALVALVEHAVAAARQMDADPHSRVPKGDELGEPTVVQRHDPAVAKLGTTALIDWAQRAEQAARDADSQITNTEGADASAGESAVAWVSMGGAIRTRKGSTVSVSAVPIAERDGEMQVDWWADTRRSLDLMPTPESIGEKAATRALRRLGGRPITTRSVPVVFEGPVASRVLGDFISGLSGARVARGASYLCDRLGTAVMHPSLTLIDDPLVPWGLRSRSFDGEGFSSQRTTVVEAGVLKTYLTNLRTASRIGCGHTRSASRSVGSAPGVASTHLHMAPGDDDLAALLREIGTGLLVTATMGHGTDLITGTYSQGATGLWFEDGEIQFPVNEVTVAGNFDQLVQGISARANDVDPWRGISAPSFAVDQLTVAGAG